MHNFREREPINVIVSTFEGGLYDREGGLFLEANNFGREDTYQKV